jgi:hypothetical protein
MANGQKSSGGGSGLSATYYDNLNFTGAAVRWLWSSPSIPKAVAPTGRLFP